MERFATEAISATISRACRRRKRRVLRLTLGGQELVGDAPRAPLVACGKPRRPDEAEVSRNPRARSATLRVAERVAD